MEIKDVEILESPFKHLDLIDIFILKEIRKKKAVCFQRFYYSKINKLFTIGYEGARLRFERLVKMGFLIKLGPNNPKNYAINAEKTGIIDRILLKFEELIIR